METWIEVNGVVLLKVQGREYDKRGENPMQVSIKGDRFLFDGQPTYAGRKWEGVSLEGLLFNSRMVQALFDDENPETRPLWAYPDTGEWDPERNTEEFIAHLPVYRRSGMLAFTVNLQGGRPISGDPFPYDFYLNSAYTPQGELKPAYMKRLERILSTANKLRMAVILGLAYFGIDYRYIADPEAVYRMAHSLVEWLASRDYRNVLIEIANERMEIRTKKGEVPAIPLMHRLRELSAKQYRDSFRLLVSTSHGGGGALPPAELVKEADFILLHGNNQSPDRHRWMIEETRQTIREVKGDPYALPILFNEAGPWLDYDHLDTWMEALKVCARLRVSWGFFDQGEGRVEGRKRVGPVYESGFQTPPVNWCLTTPSKRLFFDTLKGITGEL